jgi:iron complex transport system substrate-binding protein
MPISTLGGVPMRNKRYMSALVVTLALVVLSACKPAPTPTPAPLTITDDAGRIVEIVEIPQRFVSLAPSNTEILFALGLGEKVVGVSDFCDYPEEAKAIEKVGGVEPSLEKIVALEPDLVLTIGGNPELVSKMEELGLTVIVLAPKDLEGIYKDIELVGKAAGVEEKAASLVAEMKERVEAVAAKTKGVEVKPKVFYELDATDPSKPYTAGPGTWHDHFIKIAGGINIAADAEMQWVQLSTEEIIAKDPDIIVLGDALWGVTPDMVRERPGWDVIRAVKEGAIYPIDDNLISRPGPRVVEGIEELARIIHPELFE